MLTSVNILARLECALFVLLFFYLVCLQLLLFRLFIYVLRLSVIRDVFAEKS
jgi:hypothetical protein